MRFHFLSPAQKARSRGIWLKVLCDCVLSHGVRGGYETLEIRQCQGWIKNIRHSTNIIFSWDARSKNIFVLVEMVNSISSFLPCVIRTWEDFMGWRHRGVSTAKRSVCIFPQFKCISFPLDAIALSMRFCIQCIQFQPSIVSNHL